MTIYEEDLTREERMILLHARCDLVEELWQVCNAENYFTNGSNDQYNKMFEAAKAGYHSREVAIMIYICSEGATVEEISKKIRKPVRKFHQVCTYLQKNSKFKPKDRIAKR